MRTFDLTNITELHDVFPELTPAQFETAILFCLGLSKREIAHLRSVSYPAVRDTLQDIKIKLDFYSLNSLLAMFQVRLFIFALKGCKIKNTEKSK
ncbi:MAG TPA: helix-turn-helix transcriptional regulator [Arsenophonus nasoniae]|uniref:helix-turn-helix transcriptional regulator n=1 Tax=Arsenophonus nasoniae TaxID=638 RepID=UPI0038797270